MADLQNDECAHSKVTWSAAHINQLANNDVFEDDDYYWEFRRILDAIVAHHSCSAKSKASINRVTELLTGKKFVRSIEDGAWDSMISSCLSNRRGTVLTAA